MITYVNVKEFSPSLVCALILWRSGLGFIISKFHQFLTELSARNKSIFSFLDDNLSKYQWGFHQTWFVHLYYGDVVLDCSWANFVIFFDRVICLWYICIFVFPDDTLSTFQWTFTKLAIFSPYSSIFNRVICLWCDRGRILSFHVFIFFFYSSKDMLLDISCDSSAS